jgi:hypothetical protein
VPVPTPHSADTAPEAGADSGRAPPARSRRPTQFLPSTSAWRRISEKTLQESGGIHFIDLADEYTENMELAAAEEEEEVEAD